MTEQNTTHVFDIRGTHGSGKSYLVWTLLNRYGYEHLYDPKNEKKIIGAYCEHWDLNVVGPYRAVQGGGADQTGNSDLIEELLELFAGAGNAMVEGITVSHTYTRYHEFAKRLGTHRYHIFFLDTPLDDCIERVRERRERLGYDPDFDFDNLMEDFFAVRRMKKYFDDTTISTEWINKDTGVEQVIQRMSELTGIAP